MRTATSLGRGSRTSTPSVIWTLPLKRTPRIGPTLSDTPSASLVTCAVMRRGLWGGAAVVLLLSLPLPAHADDPGSARKAAQERANKAAARFAQAQTNLARAEAGIADLPLRVQPDERQPVALRTQVQDLALREYMRGGTSVPLLFEKDINAVARARAMVKYVTLGDVQS